MIQKIAVINFKGAERTLLATALSCASGYQLVQDRNIYEWIRLYHIDEKQMDNWETQFLLMSSSFVKRIKSEFRNSSFVSNGAAFSEVLALNEKVVGLKPEEIAILNSLLNVTGRHAARHYDLVVHVQNTGSAFFDELSIRFYEEHHIAYRLYDGSKKIKDVFENIIREVEMPMVRSAESAIYEAEQLVFYKNQKS